MCKELVHASRFNVYEMTHVYSACWLNGLKNEVYCMCCALVSVRRLIFPSDHNYWSLLHNISIPLALNCVFRGLPVLFYD